VAQCIYLNADGSVTATTETSDQCQGYVLQSRAEYASSQALQTFLAMPTQEQVTQAFNYGCVWPVFFYLVAWGVGAVANFFNHK
jgi:hypothetical protein